MRLGRCGVAAYQKKKKNWPACQLKRRASRKTRKINRRINPGEWRIAAELPLAWTSETGRAAQAQSVKTILKPGGNA